ncbi:MAG: response regulator [Syntrophobacteraceae bacterium]
MTPEKVKILLVDDEVELTRNLALVLSRRGFEVETVGDGLSALSNVANNHYDVVVLDIKMPGMSGLQVLSEIKRFAPSIQVILLTGHFSPTDEEDTLKSGAYAYLLKPFPIMKLVEVITAAARGGEMPGDSHSVCPSMSD